MGAQEKSRPKAAFRFIDRRWDQAASTAGRDFRR
jgi:hypothetical protein